MMTLSLHLLWGHKQSFQGFEPEVLYVHSTSSCAAQEQNKSACS